MHADLPLGYRQPYHLTMERLYRSQAWWFTSIRKDEAEEREGGREREAFYPQGDLEHLKTWTLTLWFLSSDNFKMKIGKKKKAIRVQVKQYFLKVSAEHDGTNL